MLGRVVKLEALDQPSRLLGGKGFVERRGPVCVEVVLHETDLFRVGKMHVRQIFENVGVIDRGVPLGDFHMPPAFQRREHHEKVGRAVALIFVIVTCGASRAHRDRRPRFLDELLAGLVHAH